MSYPGPRLSSCLFLLLATIMGALLPRDAAAQHRRDVDVIVAGPWSFVPDPLDSSRVVVVGAAAMHHNPPEVYGGDVESYSGKPVILPGKYTLDFPVAPCRNPQPPPAPATPNPVPYSLDNVDPGIVKAVVEDHDGYLRDLTRYTISLPKPCYYSSRKGSHSEVSRNLSDIGPNKPDQYLSTEMVLHYQIEMRERADFVGASDDGSIHYNDALRFLKDKSWPTPSISIVMASEPRSSDLECDGVSLMSFMQINKLFSAGLHAQFPMLPDQKTYSRNPKCVSDNYNPDHQVIDLARQALIAAAELEAYLNEPVGVLGVSAKANMDLIEKNLHTIFPDKLDENVSRELQAAHGIVFAETKAEAPRKAKASKSGEASPTQYFPFTRQVLGERSPGSGDCNTGQHSVNGVVNPIIQ